MELHLSECKKKKKRPLSEEWEGKENKVCIDYKAPYYL